MDGSIIRIAPESAPPLAETAAARLRRLKQEMKAAAQDEVRELQAAMDQVVEIAADIARAGETFPPGVLERCRGLVEEVAAARKSIELIMQRAD
jgi:hypothetical protein